MQTEMTDENNNSLALFAEDRFEPCRVCGEPSSGWHCGAVTCEACKVTTDFPRLCSMKLFKSFCDFTIRNSFCEASTEKTPNTSVYATKTA